MLVWNLFLYRVTDLAKATIYLFQSQAPWQKLSKTPFHCKLIIFYNDFDILTSMQFGSGRGKNTTLAISETMEKLLKNFDSKLATFIRLLHRLVTEAKKRVHLNCTVTHCSPISLQRDRKSTRLNSSHMSESRMPSSAWKKKTLIPNS